MNTATETKPQRLSYIRISDAVDTKTGLVYANGSARVRGYVTERWMRAHGWIA